MSAIGSIGGTSVPASSTPDSFAQLGTQEFVRIIFTELQNQDPLDPNDTQALLEQLSTLQSMQADLELINNLESIVQQNEFASAAGLIGAQVSGITDDNRRVTDVVLSVSRTPDGPVLNLLDGSRVSIANLDEITAPVVPADAPATGTDSAGGGA